MKRQLILTGLVVLLVPMMALGADQMVGTGYSEYAGAEGVGTVMTLVGLCDPPSGFTYPFPVNFAINEYTFKFVATITTVTPQIITTEYAYATTTISMYKDPGQDADYGTSPPNGTSPSTFENGTAELIGTLSGLVRIDFNLGFPEPTFVGTIDWTGGTQIGNLAPYPANGWSIHGGVSSMVPIPGGYQRNWTPKIVPPAAVPVEESTWGAIKSLYEADN